MSLESKIDKLITAVEALTNALNSQGSQTMAAPTIQVPVAAPAPIPQAAPVPQAPVAAPPVVQQQMPAAPTFEMPAAAPAPAITGAPFNDGKGLIAYVMEAYKAMGPQKGAGIQNVLTTLGYGNINDVKPEHYGTLYAQVEALKAA